jgi:cell division protein FtsA
VSNMPVRLGYPHNLHGLVETISNPAYATGVGLLHWAMRDNEPYSAQLPARPRVVAPNWLRGMGRLFKGFLPE